MRSSSRRATRPGKCASSASRCDEAHKLADELEKDGYGVVRRAHYVIAGTATKEDAEALAARLHGEVEPGGELVYEVQPDNPFVIFGGLGT